MVKDAVDHERDRLEPAVWMQGVALGLTGGIVHLAHLVHVHKRVEVSRADTGECTPDRETLAFEAARRRRDRADPPLGGGGRESPEHLMKPGKW